MIRRIIRVLFPALLLVTVADAQTNVRRLTTVDALRQYPGFYHLQNVLVRGELATEGHADVSPCRRTRSARVPRRRCQHAKRRRRRARALPGRRTSRGGRSSRRQASTTVATPSKWPQPGEELIVRISATSETQPVAGASVKSIAIEPWRYDGQTVTITGNFRGRNLFGDLPGAPGKSKYDFVLRGTEGALWVTDVRPRGQGFDLDINRRVDTDRWLEVTGTVVREKGLVSLKATRVSLSKAPQVVASDEPSAPPRPADARLRSCSTRRPTGKPTSPPRRRSAFSFRVD